MSRSVTPGVNRTRGTNVNSHDTDEEALMRIGRALVAMFAVTVTIVAGAPAWAGGASELEFDQRYLVVGHTVTGRETFYAMEFEGTGGVDDGPYHAYLLPQDTWIRPPRIPSAAIVLGTLRIFDRRPERPGANARLVFTVPEVAPGDYTIDFCNDPCTESSIGDLYGSWVQIVASPLDARFAALADRAERKLDLLAGTLRARIRRLDRAQERLEDTSGSQALLTERVADLQREVTALSRSSGARPDASGPWWVVGGAALAVLGALLARRRRRAPPPSPPEPEVGTVVFPVDPPERTAELVSPRP
jgi:MYXO-CTERM domain-containing protein